MQEVHQPVAVAHPQLTAGLINGLDIGALAPEVIVEELWFAITGRRSLPGWLRPHRDELTWASGLVAALPGGGDPWRAMCSLHARAGADAVAELLDLEPRRLARLIAAEWDTVAVVPLAWNEPIPLLAAGWRCLFDEVGALVAMLAVGMEPGPSVPTAFYGAPAVLVG